MESEREKPAAPANFALPTPVAIPQKDGSGQARSRKVFTNQKYYDEDFSERDLTHADFRGTTLFNCKFDGSDLGYANFEGANCYRSSFKRARLYYTNFRNAVLAETVMEPRDFFAVAITLTCDTFDKMALSHQWKLAWLYQLLLTKPDSLNEKVEKLLIEEIGEERFKSLQRVFRDRQI
jgi:uncharacterized protein YjbI with pentapeptide repeats